MKRVSLDTSFIIFLIFMGIGVFNSLVPLKTFAMQSPPDPPEPPDHPDPLNLNIKVNDLMKNMNSHSDEEVSIGHDLIIGQDEIIESNVVVIGADLTVYGQVNGDAVCIGGDLTVGPQAVIKGDLVNFGGKLDVDPSARTYKDRVNIGGPFGFLKGMEGADFQKFGEKMSLIAKIMRIITDCVYVLLITFLALLLTTFMPRQFNSIEEKLRNEFPKCVLLGLASMIGLPILVVGFVITLVGILAVPFLFLACFLCSLTGYIVFSRMLGTRFLPEKTIMLQILAGLLLLHSPLIIGDLLLFPGGTILSLIGHLFRVVGIILVFSLNFIGLGAVVYTLMARRQSAQPLKSQPDNLSGSLGNGNAI